MRPPPVRPGRHWPRLIAAVCSTVMVDMLKRPFQSIARSAPTGLRAGAH